MQVTLTHDFEIQQHEAGQAQWVALGFPNHSMDPHPTNKACGDPGCPVTTVSLQDAARFANKLSESASLPVCYRFDQCTAEEGGAFTHCAVWEQTVPNLYDCKGYRLPTELEWEYAARAGTRSAVYTGDIVQPRSGCELSPNVDRIAWYCANSELKIRPSGQKEPNGWGLYDTSGNVTEWVTTTWDSWGYGKGPLVDPFSRLVSDQELEVSRGGPVSGLLPMMRTASRFTNPRQSRYVGTGFRLVRTLPNR